MATTGDRTDERTRALAQGVRVRRKALGLQQQELADLAGCSERFVYSLEQGKVTVQLGKVLDVLRVLGLGLDLVPGTGSVTNTGVPSGSGGS